ncbi:unnamed protein product [Penicillium bialowiezense]
MVGNSNIEFKYEYGIALQDAAEIGKLDDVRLLLSQRVDVNVQGGTFGTALQAAAWLGHLDVVKLLLDQGVDVNGQGDKADVFKQTPLHIAASHFLAAFKILENSLNPAAKNGNVDAWALMHNFINKEDIDGCIPLHLAVENRALGAAEWLINHGADVDIENFNKITPFQRASQLKDFRMMSYLFPHVT